MSRPNSRVDVDAGTLQGNAGETPHREPTPGAALLGHTAAEIYQLARIGDHFAHGGCAEEAIAIFTQVRAWYSHQERGVDVAIMDMNIGAVRNTLRHHDDALRLWRSACEAFERDGSSETLLMMCRLNRLLLLTRLGRLDEARDILASDPGPNLATAWADHKERFSRAAWTCMPSQAPTPGGLATDAIG